MPANNLPDVEGSTAKATTSRFDSPVFIAVQLVPLSSVLNTPPSAVAAKNLFGVFGSATRAWMVPPFGPGQVLVTAAKTLEHIRICKDIQLSRKTSKHPGYLFISQILFS